jgi:hypothetical protein
MYKRRIENWNWYKYNTKRAQEANVKDPNSVYQVNRRSSQDHRGRRPAMSYAVSQRQERYQGHQGQGQQEQRQQEQQQQQQLQQQQARQGQHEGHQQGWQQQPQVYTMQQGRYVGQPQQNPHNQTIHPSIAAAYQPPWSESSSTAGPIEVNS